MSSSKLTFLFQSLVISSSWRQAFPFSVLSTLSSPPSSRVCATTTTLAMSSAPQWTPGDPDHEKEARKLEVWPLDEYNAKLLNEVHYKEPKYQTLKDPPDIEYDLIAVGSGAGGLVSSKQAARRGAKSAMISAKLAGGDCLNVGCVPSKALIRSARAISQVRNAASFGVTGIDSAKIGVDFSQVMSRLRQLRAQISPADGHSGTEATGAHVYQGRGKLTGPNTIEVNGQTLKFKKLVLATGGRPSIPNVPGLKEAPYTTNENLFNLEALPPRIVILGSGVVALEMAQTFSLIGSDVIVINRSSRLFESKGGDKEAAELLQKELEADGVKFLRNAKVDKVVTLNSGGDGGFPLMKVIAAGEEMECELLLVAAGRLANVENLGLEEAGVEYKVGSGILVNEFCQSKTNPSIYAVGDCVADVPRLTHMSGEMAKMVVQNALAGDDWKLSSLVVPAVMYTEPEYATVGIASEFQAESAGIEVDVYRTGLEHNDRAILEGSNVGFCKIVARKGTGEILGATIVAERAGEMINEVSLCIKNKIGLFELGRNIHSYPTTGEAVQFCGVQYINKNLPRFD